MTKQEYASKLLDDQWKIKRLEILERDNFSCRSCGDKHNRFHVHHKYYIDGLEPWEYEDSVLLTLCEACHALHHALEKDKLPPLFLPPFKAKPTISYEDDFMRDNYFLVSHTKKQIPANVIRQYKFLLKIIELSKSDKTTSFETVTQLAQYKLQDTCIRCNVILKTKLGEFGHGDVTNLKPEQYF